MRRPSPQLIRRVMNEVAHIYRRDNNNNSNGLREATFLLRLPSAEPSCDGDGDEGGGGEAAAMEMEITTLSSQPLLRFRLDNGYPFQAPRLVIGGGGGGGGGGRAGANGGGLEYLAFLSRSAWLFEQYAQFPHLHAHLGPPVHALASRLTPSRWLPTMHLVEAADEALCAHRLKRHLRYARCIRGLCRQKGLDPLMEPFLHSFLLETLRV